MKTKALLVRAIITIVIMVSMDFVTVYAGSDQVESNAWKNKKVATSFTLQDGMAYWYSCEDESNFQLFKCRPFLTESPAWLPMSGDYGDDGATLEALDGRLSFFLTLQDGTFIPLTYTDIVGLEKKPYYMRATYLVASTENGGAKNEKTLEFLVLPESHTLLYRWNDATGGNYKFRVRVYADDHSEMRYPKPPSVNDFYDYGPGLYAYDRRTNTFRQTFKNCYDNKQAGHYPCSAIVFYDSPDGYTITDKGPDDNRVKSVQNSFSRLDDRGTETLNPGKMFLAEHLITGPGSVSFGFCFADNLNALAASQEQIKSKTFDQWKKLTEKYWTSHLKQGYAKIERKLKCDLSKLSPVQDRVFKINLIEQKMILANNGGMSACPAAQQLYALGFPGYYNSWLRDDTLAVVYLAKMGLANLYLAPHAGLVTSCYRHETLVNGRYKWWDVFYNYCNNNEGGTQFSQVDSAFYGIWSLYKAWKMLGNDAYVTGKNYDLMTETIRYFRRALTFDPHTKKNIIYFDSKKGLFKEMRLNEADITADTPGYPRSPKTGKKLQFIDSIYVNVLYYANYLMLAEAAEHNGKRTDRDNFLNYAAELKKAINANLWSGDKQRYIACIGYNEDGYEAIDYDWSNIGFDYIWAFTLPDDKHLPFSLEIKQRCLQSVYRDGYWNNAIFGKSEIAIDLTSARRAIVDEIVADAVKPDASGGIYYYYPYSIPEGFGNTNLPQAFSISPSLYALCLTTTK